MEFGFFLFLAVLIVPNAVRRDADRRHRLAARRRPELGIRRYPAHNDDFIEIHVRYCNISSIFFVERLVAQRMHRGNARLRDTGADCRPAWARFLLAPTRIPPRDLETGPMMSDRKTTFAVSRSCSSCFASRARRKNGQRRTTPSVSSLDRICQCDFFRLEFGRKFPAVLFHDAPHFRNIFFLSGPKPRSRILFLLFPCLPWFCDYIGFTGELQASFFAFGERPFSLLYLPLLFVQRFFFRERLSSGSCPPG